MGLVLLFRSMSDVRFAFRRLRAAPGFTIAAVLTLALGLGANTLTFSAIRGLLIQPLPFAHGDRLVWVQGRNAQVNVGDHVAAGDVIPDVHPGIASLNPHETIAVRKRQRLDQQAADGAERQRVGAEAEGERQNRRDGETGGGAESAEGESGVGHRPKQ